MSRSSINSTALIHHTTRALIPLSSVLDLNIYASPAAPIHAASLSPFLQSTHDHENCEEGHTHAYEAHSNDITSVAIPLPFLADVHQGTFSDLVMDLLWEGSLPALPSSAPSSSPPTSTNPTNDASPSSDPAPTLPEFDILRTKAFLRTHDDKAYVLQGVREMFDIREVPLSAVAEDEVTPKLVLIGRGLSEGVKERFLAALEAGNTT